MYEANCSPTLCPPKGHCVISILVVYGHRKGAVIRNKIKIQTLQVETEECEVAIIEESEYNK